MGILVLSLETILFTLALRFHGALTAKQPTSLATRDPASDAFHTNAAKAAKQLAAFLADRLSSISTAWSNPIVGLPPGTATERRIVVKIDGQPSKSFALRRQRSTEPGAPPGTMINVAFDVQAAAQQLGATLELYGETPPNQPATYRLSFTAKERLEISGDEEAIVAMGLRRGIFERINHHEMMYAAEILDRDLAVDDDQTGGGSPGRLADLLMRAESAIRSLDLFVDVMGGIPVAVDDDAETVGRAAPAVDDPEELKRQRLQAEAEAEAQELERQAQEAAQRAAELRARAAKPKG
jgi:hypothetical protein